jgi:hypothetical protein
MIAMAARVSQLSLIISVDSEMVLYSTNFEPCIMRQSGN